MISLVTGNEKMDVAAGTIRELSVAFTIRITVFG